MSNSYRDFVLLWAAMLVSTTGSFALQLTLSAEVYAHYSSGLLASAVFSSHWVLPVLLAPLISNLASSRSPKSVLIISEAVSALLAGTIAFAGTGLLPLTIVALMLRGFFESLAKTSRMVALKHHVEPQRLAKLTGIFNTSLLLGNGIGGLVSSILSEHFALKQIALMTMTMFAFSATISTVLSHRSYVLKFSSWLGTLKSSLHWGDWAAGGRDLARAGLLPHLLVLLISVGVFQAFHNVARTALPMGLFGGGARDVSLMQVSTCVGLVLGAFAASWWQRRNLYGRLEQWMLFLTALAGLVPFLVSKLAYVFPSYAVFMFFFEVTFVLAQTKIMVDAPKEHIGRISAFMNPILLGTMILGATLFGQLSDTFGIVLSSFSATGLGLILLLMVHFKVFRRMETP